MALLNGIVIGKGTLLAHAPSCTLALLPPTNPLSLTSPTTQSLCNHTSSLTSYPSPHPPSPQLLFDRLSTEPPATRGTLQASLSSLASAYDQSGYRLSLYGTIEGAAQSPTEAARACAVEWAVRLFEYRDAR